jgi:hypothetical protein
MDVCCVIPQKLVQTVGNLEAQKSEKVDESREEKNLFANVENGARLDRQKNAKALYNSACQLLLPCQAHSQPEQNVCLLFLFCLFIAFDPNT